MTTPILIMVMGLVAQVGQLRASEPQRKPPSVPELVAALQSPDIAVRAHAAGTIRFSDSLYKEPPVRAALMKALGEETELELVRWRKIRQGLISADDPRPDAPERATLLAGLLSSVAKADGQDVLAALLPYVYTGAGVRTRVAAYGPPAMPALVELADSGDGPYDTGNVRQGALMTLADIVRTSKVTTGERIQLEGLSRRSLWSSEAPVVAGATFLAVALQVPDLVSETRRLRDGNFGGRSFSAADKRIAQSAATNALSAAGIR
jgi:hypothetical protein